MAQRRLQPLSVSMLLAVLITLFAVSCSPGVDPPEVRLNPSPQQRYEITLTIKGPPGEVSAVTGDVQFDVEDKKCMPMTDPIAGVWKHTSFTQPVTFRHEGSRYVGFVYADQLLNEDYFGLGTCQWHLTGVLSEFRVGPVQRFISISTDEVIEEQTVQGVCSFNSVTRNSCLTPPNAERFYEPTLNFMATIQSRKISQ